MPEKTFSEGIYLNTVHEKAPEFIKANVSINIEKAIAWLQLMKATGKADDKGYIRLVGKESKEGKRYFELGTWKPNAQANTAPAASEKDIEFPEEYINPADIPF